jgi:hypothetical protein
VDPVSIALIIASGAGLAGLRAVKEWASERTSVMFGGQRETEPTVELSVESASREDLEDLAKLMQQHNVLIRETAEPRPARRAPAPRQGAIELPSRKAVPSRDVVRLVVQVAITISVLGAALYVILGGSDDNDTKNWAFGAAGAIVGYWLSGPTS